MTTKAGLNTINPASDKAFQQSKKTNPIYFHFFEYWKINNFEKNK